MIIISSDPYNYYSFIMVSQITYEFKLISRFNFLRKASIIMILTSTFAKIVVNVLKAL